MNEGENIRQGRQCDMTSSKEKENILTRRLRDLNISERGATRDARMMSRVQELKESMERHNDNMARLMLTSKESLERRTQIETAFRANREAFVELSTILLDVLGGKR